MTFQSKKTDNALTHTSGGRRDELDLASERAADLRAEIPSAPKRTNVLEGLKNDYEKPAFPSRDKRIAHLLMWCAKNYPGQPVTWKDIYKVLRDGETAKAASIETFAKAGGHVNKILLENWGRCLVREKSKTVDHGVRASVDDNDTAIHAVDKSAKAVVSAHKRWARVASAINPAKVRDPHYRKFLTSKPIVALTRSAVDVNYLQKLLPPAPENGKKTDSTK